MQVEPSVPRELGQYRPLEFIGSGGMGEVWLANKQGLAKPCVLKILRPRLALDDGYRRRFFREAQIGASLRHGRIVPMQDFGEAHGHLYLVMEFVDGIDLARFCRALADEGERLPLAAVGYVIGEVFEALRHAHNRTVAGKPRGVIHRDVTPSNVLISSEGEVFLTDFGIARYEADLSDEAFGTLKYIAPEQARGEACFESDIYGAAGVLHFMLAGEAPREVTSVGELQRILDAPPPGLSREDVPAALEKLRSMGLEPALERRIATADDALTLIDAWPGYRKGTRVLSELYRRFVGKPRSGMTKIEEAAEALLDDGETRSVEVPQGLPAAPPESARMTVKISREQELEAGEPGASPWLHPDDEVPTQRFDPASTGPEPNAPLVQRRRRRFALDPSAGVRHLPAVGESEAAEADTPEEESPS
ncbi:MAG: serine/threonine-protein kinase [Myxococcota bacterium]